MDVDAKRPEGREVGLMRIPAARTGGGGQKLAKSYGRLLWMAPNGVDAEAIPVNLNILLLSQSLCG